MLAKLRAGSGRDSRSLAANYAPTHRSRRVNCFGRDRGSIPCTFTVSCPLAGLSVTAISRTTADRDIDVGCGLREAFGRNRYVIGAGQQALDAKFSPLIRSLPRGSWKTR